MHAHTETRTARTHARARARTHTHTHTHTHARARARAPVAYQGNQGNETEEKVIKKRRIFKEDLKELTQVEWRGQKQGVGSR